MNFQFPLAAGVALVLAGCVTTTPYQALRDGQGFSEQKLESNRYQVKFAGNSSTPRQTVENYLMYRAAEVTLAGGYDYFILASQNTEAQTKYVQTFSGFDDPFFWHPRFGASVGSAIPSTEYEAQVDIVMFKGRKPASEVRAFDAHEVKANLETIVVRAK